MPLYRNENASQKTLAFKGLDTYVKENYMLSRERATVFTQTSSDSSIDLKPEFVSKGKGTRTKLNPLSGIKFQWSEKGLYRIDQLKQTIMNFPNRFNPFTCKDFAIYVLDNYAVHLMAEVRTLLWERGYVLIINVAKIPSPSRGDMMKIIATAWNKLNVIILALSKLFL